MARYVSVKTGDGQMEEIADTVDGATGEQGIADAFASIFKKLYNSSGSEVEMTELQDRLRGLVGTENSKEEICKVSLELVKQAACTLQPHKMDVSQGFSSGSTARVRRSFCPPGEDFQELAESRQCNKVSTGVCHNPPGEEEQGPRPAWKLPRHRRVLPAAQAF